MKCINCGKEIDDNVDKCEFCGEVYAEPFKLDKDSIEKAKQLAKEKEKENRKKEEEEKLKKKKEEREKRIDKEGAFYEKKSAYYISLGASLLAAIMMMASPFLKWESCYVRMGDEAKIYGFGLFNILKGGNKLYLLFIILIILNGLAMIYITLIDHKNLFNDKIKFLNNEPAFIEKYHYISRLAPFVFAVIIMIICMKMKSYTSSKANFANVYDAAMSQINTYKEYFHSTPDMEAKMGHGAGFYEYLFSIIIYLGTRCYKFVIDTLNEDE